MIKTFLFFQLAVLSCLSGLLTAQDKDYSPVDITVGRDNIMLKGKFYAAEGQGPFPTVILLPGFPGNPNDVLGLGKKLSQNGINAMMINYSGTHQSQGVINFDNTQSDIAAAFLYINNPANISSFKIDTARIILGGYSYGGGMAMTYSVLHPETTKVFTIAGVDWGEYLEEYLRNPDFKKEIDNNIEKMESSPEIVRFGPGAKPEEVTEAGLDKLNTAYFLRKSANLLASKDILIVGGCDDTGPTMEQYILPLYRALKLQNAQKVKIAAFQDDHSFSKSRAALAETVVDWINAVCDNE